MEAIYSSETSVDFQRITRRYIPEDITLESYRWENLKSYRMIKFDYSNPSTLKYSASQTFSSVCISLSGERQVKQVGRVSAILGYRSGR
jgi:hypothetical protein